MNTLSKETSTKRSLAPSDAVALTGSKMVAEAMRQTDPDVVAAFPITPTTMMIETFSQYVADGKVNTEFIAVESEHSAMAACIGAASAGGRAQTVTTSQGLALMWELLYVASGLRLPVVMHCANRGLSAPVTLHTDHGDTMGARDSGWIQLYDASGQEAYDNALMAVRIAEHPEVRLPVLHTQDGFTVTHNLTRGELLPDDMAREFLGKYRPDFPLLNVDQPVSIGNVVYSDHYFEFKRQQLEAMNRALEVIPQIGQEFGQLTGRFYGLVEPYQVEDADLVAVVLGSTAGTVKSAVDALRQEGLKAGMLRVRSFRPFPSQQVADALEGKTVAVLDRAVSPGGAAHPLFQEVSAALHLSSTPTKLVNYLYGIGGRNASAKDFRQVFAELELVARSGNPLPLVRYLGLKEQSSRLTDLRRATPGN